MGYDIYRGVVFAGAQHELTIEDHFFDELVAVQTQVAAKTPLLRRMCDAYGDADFENASIPEAIAQLAEIRIRARSDSLRTLCDQLRSIFTRAHADGQTVFGRGD